MPARDSVLRERSASILASLPQHQFANSLQPFNGPAAPTTSQSTATANGAAVNGRRHALQLPVLVTGEGASATSIQARSTQAPPRVAVPPVVATPHRRQAQEHNTTVNIIVLPFPVSTSLSVKHRRVTHGENDPDQGRRARSC